MALSIQMKTHRAAYCAPGTGASKAGQRIAEKIELSTGKTKFGQGRGCSIIKGINGTRGAKYGPGETGFRQILWPCEGKKKNELTIKFHLTNLIFRYISESQVVKSGKRWYGPLKRGG